MDRGLPAREADPAARPADPGDLRRKFFNTVSLFDPKIRVAELAGQIAARKAHKNRRLPRPQTLALQGIKHFHERQPPVFRGGHRLARRPRRVRRRPRIWLPENRLDHGIIIPANKAMQLFPHSGVRFRMKRLNPRLWMFLPGAVFFAAGLWLRPFITHPQPPLPAIPAPVMPKSNAFDFYVAASRQMQGQAQLSHLDRLSQSQELALVQKNARALKTLRQGLSLPYQPPPARSVNDKFPFYQQQRDLARLLAAEGHVQAAHGSWEGAVHSDLDAIQMGSQVVHGSPLIGCLVGLACEAIGRRPLWTAISHLNAAEARVAIRRLQTIQAGQTPFADTMQEERWFGQAAMQEQLRHPPLQQYPEFLKSIPLSNYTRYMDRSVTNARQPYAVHPAAPIPPRDSLCILFLPVFNNVYLRVTDSETQNALLSAALALRAYRLEHGIYPATLDSLIPAYLSVVPSDPFALSGPLHLRRTKLNYVLYSVGPDGKDDGGRPILHAPTALGAQANRSRYFIQETSRGDVVAGVNL